MIYWRSSSVADFLVGVFNDLPGKLWDRFVSQWGQSDDCWDLKVPRCQLGAEMNIQMATEIRFKYSTTNCKVVVHFDRCNLFFVVKRRFPTLLFGFYNWVEEVLWGCTMITLGTWNPFMLLRFKDTIIETTNLRWQVRINRQRFKWYYRNHQKSTQRALNHTILVANWCHTSKYCDLEREMLSCCKNLRQ